MMKQLSTGLSFLFFPATVLLAHLIASRVLHLYLIFPNLDIPFHFIGGLSIAYMSVSLLSFAIQEKLLPGSLPNSLSLVLIFTVTATATVFWEFAEFIADQLMSTNIQVSLANTMQDQFLGVLGGTTWIMIIARKFDISRAEK